MDLDPHASRAFTGGRKAWLNATYALQSNEPLPAMQLLLAATEKYNAAYRSRAEMALAFQILEINNRSEGLVGGLAAWLAPTKDRQYGEAVLAFVRKDHSRALAILKERAEAYPEDALVLADLAHFETLIHKKPSPIWKQVAKLQPDHPVHISQPRKPR